MKKLFIIAAALALFSACNKQMEFTCEQDLTYKTLSVSAAQTKTTLNAEGGIDWLATDNLAVLESAGESTTTYKSGNANIAAEGGLHSQ